MRTVQIKGWTVLQGRMEQMKEMKENREELAKHIVGENGIHYTLGEDELYYPDLEYKTTNYQIRKYGRMRASYLKEERKVLYANLLVSGELNQHLHEVDEEAFEMLERLMEVRKEAWGITEELKVKDMMKWVGLMGSLQSAVEEEVVREVLYR